MLKVAHLKLLRYPSSVMTRTCVSTGNGEFCGIRISASELQYLHIALVHPPMSVWSLGNAKDLMVYDRLS